MDLQGRAVLITGANRGIGAALVQALLGTDVGRIHAGMRETSGYTPADPRVQPLRLDVTDPASVAAAAQAVPSLDLLINNAGVLTCSPFLDSDSLDGARQEMEVNYWGTLNVLRAFQGQLRKAGRERGATVMNVMSSLALITYPFCGSYCASKYAVHSLTLGVRAELAADGVHVIEAYPGLTDTRMASDLAHLPKSQPADVAAAFVAAIVEDAMTVFIGDDATGIRDAIASDPLAAQAQADAFLKL